MDYTNNMDLTRKNRVTSKIKVIDARFRVYCCTILRAFKFI